MSQKQDHLPRERAEFVCDTAGSILSVRVRGEIDHHTASAIRKGIDATLFEKRPKKLLFDLSAVSFMDSSGLGLIMGRFSVMKELGGEMVVWNPSAETRSILNLAGMERLVRIEYPGGNEPSELADKPSRPRTSPVREAAVESSRPRKRKKPASVRTLAGKEKEA